MDSSVPGLVREGTAFLVVAAVGIAMGRRGLNDGADWRLYGQAAMGSLAFFAIPSVLLDVARRYASETNVAVVFSVAPVVVMLACTIREVGWRMRLLVPALAGLSGALSLLPFGQPSSSLAWVSLGELFVAMLLVSCSGVWLYERLCEMSIVDSLSVIGAPNAVALLGWCALRGLLAGRWSDVASGRFWTVLVDAGVTGLTVVILRSMDPVRFSSRFLIIPLVTVLEGLVLLRPAVTSRLVVGIALLAVGAGCLILEKEPGKEEILTLR